MKKAFLRFLSVSLAVMFALTVVPLSVSADATQYSITQLAGRYKTQGRTTLQDGTLLLDWSASGIEFSAMCSGDVKVTFDAIKVPSGDTNGTYFTVIVDGLVQFADSRTPEDTTADNWNGNTTNYPFHITETGEITYTVASDLQYGKHTFEIYKQAEANYDILGIKSISLNGTFLSAPENKDLYIEVIGDSIAATASNLATGADGSGSMYQDATQGWPYMTARNLDADWSVIAKSGIMATEVPNHTSMQTAYKLQRFYSNDNATLYGFDRQPDVVVICLGTNDNYHANGEDIVAGMTQMLNLVREKNPDAKIVWIYGMMTTGVNSRIEDILKTAGGWRKGYYGLLLEREDTGHPKMDMQYLYTKELTKFIKNTVLNPNYNGKSGLESGDSIIYRATDSADNVYYDKTTDTETASPYRSGEDTVWKFGVSGLGDTFLTSYPDFAAPTAEITDDNYLKLFWTEPEATAGKTTVKIIGDTYNKEVYVAGTSVILKDAPLDEKLQIQVTVGDKSSEVLSFYNDPILTEIKVTDANKKETTKIDQTAYLYADLTDVAEKIDQNTGLLIKLESVITRDDIMITHYSDLKEQNGGFVERNSDSPVANFRTPISLNDIGYSFSWKMTPATIKADGTYSASNTAFTNNTTNRTRNFYAYDHALTDRAAAIKNTTQISLALGSGLYQNFYKSGYIFVPFEAFTDSDLQQIKNTGVISLKADSFKYRGRVRRNQNGNQDVYYVQYGCTNLDETHTNTADLSGFIDREMHYSQVSFVNDFDSFVNSFINDTTTTITTPVSSVSTAVTGITYMNSAANGNDYTLKNNLVDSYYTIDYTNLYKTKVIFTTAGGEKMKLGFTAVYDGEYQISAPITAEIAKGVYYRVVKESANGAKGVLIDERKYNGEEYLALLNTKLISGDTVYIEVWADSVGTTIDLGVPQVVYLGENATEDEVKYSMNEYFAVDHTNDLGYKSVWRGGTFTYPFSIDGKEYNYLYDDAYLSAVEANSVIDYDSSACLDLAAYDNKATVKDETDGSALYNLFKEYDSIAVYTEGSSNDYFYQTSDSRIRNYANAETGYTYGGNPLRYFNSVGMLSVSKVPSDTGIKIMHGFGVAPGGGARNVYMNFGHYQQFIAPSGGTAKLDLGGNENSGKVIVLHNKKVVASYTGGTLPDYDAANELVLNKGDTISVVYGKIDLAEKGLVATNTSEVNISTTVWFTPQKGNESKIGFDSATPTLIKSLQSNGSVIILPSTSKAGAVFRGWIADGKTYAAGSDFTVSEDTEFKADFIYYGDLDGSGEGLDSTDLTLMRRVLTGTTHITDTVNGKITADIDTNGKTDLKDLVRMKKMAAEMRVSVGVE